MLIMCDEKTSYDLRSPQVIAAQRPVPDELPAPADLGGGRWPDREEIRNLSLMLSRIQLHSCCFNAGPALKQHRFHQLTLSFRRGLTGVIDLTKRGQQDTGEYIQTVIIDLCVWDIRSLKTMDIESMLAHRLRSWPNNKPTLVQSAMLAGVEVFRGALHPGYNEEGALLEERVVHVLWVISGRVPPRWPGRDFYFRLHGHP